MDKPWKARLSILPASDDDKTLNQFANEGKLVFRVDGLCNLHSFFRCWPLYPMSKSCICGYENKACDKKICDYFYSLQRLDLLYPSKSVRKKIGFLYFYQANIMKDIKDAILKKIAKILLVEFTEHCSFYVLGG